MEKWMVSAKKADFQKLAAEFGIDPVTARLIRNRDIVGEEAMREYLYGDLTWLHDPHLLKDMDKRGDPSGRQKKRQITKTKQNNQ